jgi:hypothetical protein
LEPPSPGSITKALRASAFLRRHFQENIGDLDRSHFHQHRKQPGPEGPRSLHKNERCPHLRTIRSNSPSAGAGFMDCPNGQGLGFQNAQFHLGTGCAIAENIR